MSIFRIQCIQDRLGAARPAAYLPLFPTKGIDWTFGDTHDWGSLLAKAPPAEKFTHDLRYAAVCAFFWADALSSLAIYKEILAPLTAVCPESEQILLRLWSIAC